MTATTTTVGPLELAAAARTLAATIRAGTVDDPGVTAELLELAAAELVDQAAELAAARRRRPPAERPALIDVLVDRVAALEAELTDVRGELAYALEALR